MGLMSVKSVYSGCLVFLLSFQLNTVQAKDIWAVNPNYESFRPASSAFDIVDGLGNSRVIYSDSYAALIIEGAYKDSAWDRVVGPGAENEARLRDALELRGFHVLVWRDLDSHQLPQVVDDLRKNIGYRRDARLFFYYYGHGYVLGSTEDTSKPDTFLVPVDAPNPLADEVGFFQAALPIDHIVQLARDFKLKHAFFALEACRAGSIIGSLDGPQPLNPRGYILSKQILNASRQFLTAGNADQDIPAAGDFSILLAKGLSDGDLDHDGYVTGTELMTYVVLNLPKWSVEEQHPEQGQLFREKFGDFIFGRAKIDGTVEVEPSPVVKPVAPIEPVAVVKPVAPVEPVTPAFHPKDVNPSVSPTAPTSTSLGTEKETYPRSVDPPPDIRSLDTNCKRGSKIACKLLEEALGPVLSKGQLGLDAACKRGSQIACSASSQGYTSLSTKDRLEFDTLVGNCGRGSQTACNLLGISLE